MNQFDETTRQIDDSFIQNTVSAKVNSVLSKDENDLSSAKRILQQITALHQQHKYHFYYS